MPKTKKGILVRTDAATKIYLMTLRDNFIIKEIDDHSLFIEESKMDYVKRQVQDFKNKYSYEKPK